jgi:hypothetical protein
MVLSANLLCGQQAPPPKPPAESLSLEEIQKRIGKLEEDVTHSMEAAQAAVEEEAKAKHITESVAQSLRWTFRPSAVASGVDLRSVISTAQVPSDNARLTAAVKELEGASARLQGGRADMYNEAKNEIRRRVAETVRHASKPEEVGAVIAALKFFETSPRGQPSSTYFELPTLVNNATNLLTSLQRLLYAQAAGNSAAIGTELASMRQQSGWNRTLLTGGELEAREQTIVAPAQKAVEQTRDALEAAVAAQKPASELSQLLAAHLEALDRWTTLRPPETRSYNDNPHQKTALGYGQLIGLRSRLEKGLVPFTESEIAEAERAVEGIGPKAAVYTALIKAWQQEGEQLAVQRYGEKVASIAKRLGAAQKPADLEAVVPDVAAWEQEPIRFRRLGTENPGQYARYLRTLSFCWSNPSPALHLQAREAETQAVGGPFGQEIAALKDRVERDVMSRLLNAPELKAPPLSEQPVAAALETLSDDLAAKGEWRRLYELLRTRGPFGREALTGREDETVIALRAFFAGQNMELAEQWAEAGQLYKQVLQSASARAPVKPAAERLKLIAKEHPDAFKTSQ